MHGPGVKTQHSVSCSAQSRDQGPGTLQKGEVLHQSDPLLSELWL